MDNDYVLNLDDILHTVETADVIRIRFQLLDKRLVIDNRISEVEGPLVRLVNRAGSSEESFRNLKRMRPRFPLPEKMTAIFWPKYANTLRTTGIWSAIVKRIEATGFKDSRRQCDEVMHEMLEMERREIRNALSGEGFQTVWQRTRT
jgi:predicted RNA binding protein YcfA (HicA-like mRNA interferase family)